MKTDAQVVWLVSFSHFITHGYMTILPAVLVAIAGEQSMSFMELGLIANIGYFLYGFGAFPAGYLADRFGSKKLLTIGVLGMAVSSMLISTTSSILSFALTYTLLGTFASIHHPAGLSFIARRVEYNKGRAMGLHGVMGNIGLFLSPMVAAFSMMLFGTWRAAYLTYGLIGLVFFYFLYSSRIEGEEDLSFKRLLCTGKKSTSPENEPPSPTSSTKGVEPPKAFYISLALLFLFMGSILSGFIFRGSLTFLPALFQQNITPIANHDEPVVMAGYAATAVLSLGLFGAWFGGYINDKTKYPEFVPAIIFLIITPALYFASRLMDMQLILTTGVFSLIYYAWQPSQNYLIAKYTKKSSHGMGFGINFFLIFGIGSLATSVGGWFADELGIDRFYAAMSLIACTGILVALTVYPLRSYAVDWKRKTNKIFKLSEEEKKGAG